MMTVVLLAAMTAGENVAEFHPRGGGGCAGGCYGYTYNTPYYGGCYGRASYNCGGGCYGGRWATCHGGACYGSCYGGCYGMGYTATGGCWGASYSGYGPAPYAASGYGCAGGCGGYLSAAYGVPGPVVGVPVGGSAVGMADASLGNRARVVFTLPEGAKLFIDGQPVAITSTSSTFRTPELKPGTKYFYEARVEIVKGDKVGIGTQKVYVSAGETAELDLTKVEMKETVVVTAAR